MLGKKEIAKIQQDIKKVIDFMKDMPETDSNITELKAMLQALGPDIITLSPHKHHTEIVHMTIAGEVFTIPGKSSSLPTLKPKFLKCILDIKPELLCTEYFDSEGKILQLLTPLRLSIKNRNVDMINAVFNHEAFTSYMHNDAAGACDQLFRAYMQALRWYDETNSIATLTNMMLKVSGITNADKHAAALLKNQNQILPILFEKCKAAMKIARSKGNCSMLPKKIMKTFLFDGIAGEAFTLHAKPNLLKLQLNGMFDICKAFYPTDQEITIATKAKLWVSSDAIMRFIELRKFISKDETAKNIKIFEASLKALHQELGPDLFKEFLNVTGRAKSNNQFCTAFLSDFASAHKKQKFAKCIKDIVEIANFVGKIEILHGMNQGSIPKLIPMIKDRNIPELSKLLDNKEFLNNREKNIENVCSELVEAYMWALLWYDATKTSDEQKILQILSQTCKDTMVIACKQGKTGLPDTIMNMCAIKGVCGNSFLQHTNYDLVQHQLRMAGEVCDAFKEVNVEAKRLQQTPLSAAQATHNQQALSSAYNFKTATEVVVTIFSCFMLVAICDRILGNRGHEK